MNNVMFSGPIAWFYHVMISFYSCSNGTFFLLNSSPGGHSSDVRSQLRKYWNLSFIFCFSKLILRAWWSWTLLQPKLLRHYYSQIDKDTLRKLSRLYQVINQIKKVVAIILIVWSLRLIILLELISNLPFQLDFKLFDYDPEFIFEIIED